MRVGIIGLPDWAARARLLGAEVAHAGPPVDIMARAARALPGLYDRMPPPGTLRLVAEPEQAVAGADLVLAAAGQGVAATAPVVGVGGWDEAAEVELYAGTPAWLVPEVVLKGASGPVIDALAHLGVAPVTQLSSFAVDRGTAPEAQDAALVGMLRALRHAGQGAGRILAATEALWPRADPDWSRPVETADRAIPLDWTDYNGHMTEARYLDGFGDATTRLMEMLGCDAAYIAAGHSFFTAETHIRHLGEAAAGERVRVETQALMVEGAKMHIFHRMWRGDALVATGEHFMLHVSLAARRPCPPRPPVDARLARMAAGHARLPRPEGAGRAVGQKR
jgi:carnitine 3-dehydrogenase